MDTERQLQENIKKVLGLPDEPVAQTASGFQMLNEDPLRRVRCEAECFLHAICGDSYRTRFTSNDTVWLMVAFTKHLWTKQELIWKYLDEYMNRTIQPMVIPGLSSTEASFIKEIVAEAIGSQDVRFDRPAIEAVRSLRDAFKRLQEQNNPFQGEKFGR